MTNQELHTIIVNQFEYIYSKVMHFNDYEFTPSDNQKKQISSFIDYLDKNVGTSSIGSEWMFEYLVYSFKQRVEQKTRYEGKIPFNWIVGKKSFELFEKRGENWLYWNDLFKTEYNIKLSDLNALEAIKDDVSEELREIYCSTHLPIQNCIGTVSYSNTSKWCEVCKNNEECKILNR